MGDRALGESSRRQTGPMLSMDMNVCAVPGRLASASPAASGRFYTFSEGRVGAAENMAVDTTGVEAGGGGAAAI